MTDPIKIMDEIERDEISIFHEGRWQSLCTALEAQAEELAQAEQEVKNAEGWFNAYQSIDSWLFEQLNGEFVVEHDKPDDNTIASIKKLLAHKDARIARLQAIIEGLRVALGGDPENIEREAKEGS